jgi:hypothetical protein
MAAAPVYGNVYIAIQSFSVYALRTYNAILISMGMLDLTLSALAV